MMGRIPKLPPDILLERRVRVPNPDMDKAPHLRLHSVVVGGSGTVGGLTSREHVTGEGMSVTLGTTVMFHAFAENRVGGVKELSLTLAFGQKTTTVTASNAPDELGTVSPSLDIVGTDGKGRPGNMPIQLSMTSATLPFPIPGSVRVSATNFNGMNTTFEVGFVPTWKVPQIHSFVAKPDYIYSGTPVELSWNITDCEDFCTVRIEGHDGLAYSNLVESHPNLSAKGTLTVRPTRSTLTQYTLTASNPDNFAASKTVRVQLAPPPANPNRPFWFRMENPNSWADPCFTVEMWAPDANTAKQEAERQNGSYRATEINETQYRAGC
jgi:hypothetical protein